MVKLFLIFIALVLVGCATSTDIDLLRERNMELTNINANLNEKINKLAKEIGYEWKTENDWVKI